MTKIHAIAGGQGKPVCFQLSTGNINDSTQAVDVLPHVELSESNILGNKARGTVAVREYITSKGAAGLHDPKSNTPAL